MKAIDAIAMILLIIGGLNWGLVGLFNFNLVAAIFGANTTITNIIYILVGVAALWSLFTWNGFHRRLGGVYERETVRTRKQPVG